MYHEYSVEKRQEQTGEEESQKWANELERYLQPYTQRLDAYLDRRIVGNLTGLIGSLSGATGRRGDLDYPGKWTRPLPAHVQAGVGRLDRALHHTGWDAEIIEDVMWEQAERKVNDLVARGVTPVLIMDSSCLGKPESQTIVGASAVCSSQGRRLTQYRPHISNPVSVPIRVPGYEWECLIEAFRPGAPPDRCHPVVETGQRGQWATTAASEGLPARSEKEIRLAGRLCL